MHINLKVLHLMGIRKGAHWIQNLASDLCSPLLTEGLEYYWLWSSKRLEKLVGGGELQCKQTSLYKCLDRDLKSDFAFFFFFKVPLPLIKFHLMYSGSGGDGNNLSFFFSAQKMCDVVCVCLSELWAVRFKSCLIKMPYSGLNKQFFMKSPHFFCCRWKLNTNPYILSF